MATDGSGYRITVSNYYGASVVGPNGTLEGGNLNGNYYSYGSNPNGTDTLGRNPLTITSSCTGNPNLICYDILNSQGTTSRYTVTTQSVPVHTAFGSFVTEFSGNITVVQSVGLPDGTSYVFSYDTGTAPGNYGELVGISLPTGGQVNYGYTNFTIACSAAPLATLPYRWLSTRTSGGGTWTYTPQIVTQSSCMIGQPAGQQQVTVTKPNGDNTVYAFTLPAGGGVQLTQVQTYSGSVSPANTLSTRSFTWDPSLTIPRIVSETETYPMPGGTSLSKTTQSAYNSQLYSNVTTLSEWKYYSAGLPATPDRITSSVYTATDANYTSYLTANILNLPTSITITSGGGTQLAQAKYSYDSTSLVSQTGSFQHDDTNYGTGYTVRGNLTQLQRWAGGTNYLTSTMTYDTTGQLRSAQDPLLNTTSFSYSDNFFTDAPAVVVPPSFTAPVSTNAYVTQITLPRSGSHVYGYYYGTGKGALFRDQNGADSYAHFLDPLDRPTVAYGPILPSGNRPWSLTNYSSLETQTDNFTGIRDATASSTCSSCAHGQTLLDGLGRITTQELVNDPDGPTFFNTSYDINGRVQNTSHAYRSTGDSTYGTETPTYDALGRVIKMTHPDGTHSQAFYGAAVAGTGLGGVTSQLCSSTTYGLGYPVLVLDEAGKKRETWTDGFGSVIEVDEPDANGNLTSPTCYQYDLLGNLVQTLHGNQTRSYTYDSLSRVTSSTVPERAAGTTGTTYFYYTTSSGALCSGDSKEICRRTDPRGITTIYSYDSIYRLTAVSYSDATPAVTYLTDQTNCGTTGLSNGLGRATGMAVSDGSNSALWCYDSAGHLITDRRTIAGLTKTISYTFNSNGSLASIVYPSGRTLAYNIGNAGRPLSAIDSNGIQYALAPSLAGQTGWTYAPMGSVNSLVYGQVVSGFSGITENRSYNNRLELTNIQASSANGNPLNLALCNTSFSFSTGCSTSATNNNSNLTGVANNIDPG